MRLLLLPLVMLITPVALSEDYVWKSKAEPIDYKCVVEREVGIDWENGSRLVEFDSKGYKDIFLTHISNIPTVGLPSPRGSLNERRSIMEQKFSSLSSDPDYIYEEGSYFIRTEDSDPKSFQTYLLSQTCSYSGDVKYGVVSCSDLRGTFSLYTKTKRFVQSGLGGWHFGSSDPAVLRYGTCREYFR